MFAATGMKVLPKIYEFDQCFDGEWVQQQVEYHDDKISCLLLVHGTYWIDTDKIYHMRIYTPQNRPRCTHLWISDSTYSAKTVIEDDGIFSEIQFVARVYNRTEEGRSPTKKIRVLHA